MKFLIRIYKNAMNPKSKHHIQSGIVFSLIVAALILAPLQFGQVIENFHYIKDLEQENILLQDENNFIINELTITRGDLSTLQEKFDKLFSRFENEQEYITINIEEILREMDYKYIQYDIKLDEVDHSNCDSKIDELYRDLEDIRKDLK